MADEDVTYGGCFGGPVHTERLPKVEDRMAEPKPFTDEEIDAECASWEAAPPFGQKLVRMLRQLLAQRREADAKVAAFEQVVAALRDIADWDKVSLAGEWEAALCSIIRSITDKAHEALAAAERATGGQG